MRGYPGRAGLLMLGMLMTTAYAQTDQRPGTTGEFGQQTTLGVKEPWYVTVKGLEYSVSRLVIGTNYWAPAHDQKLLVLWFAVQNPRKEPANLWSTSLTFTVYDADNNAYPAIDTYGVDETGMPLNMVLQPAQKVQLHAGFRLPAGVTVTKLMVASEVENEPVIRYALKQPLPGLAPPWVDAQQPTRRLPEVAAQAGDWYPLAWCDVRLQQTGPAEGLDRPAPEGKQWLCATLTVRNAAPEEQPYLNDVFAAVLQLDGGEEAPLTAVYLANAWREPQTALRPKGELTLRLLFAVPAETAPTCLCLQTGLHGNDDTKSHKLLFALAPKAK